MHQTITILFILLLTLKAQSQKTESLEGMSPPEIRNLLLTQTESADAREMIIKHNRSRITAYGFLGAAVILAGISKSVSDPDQDNRDSIVTAVWAGYSGLIGTICGIAAAERIKKAKGIYMNNMQASSVDKVFIRSDVEIQKLMEN